MESKIAKETLHQHLQPHFVLSSNVYAAEVDILKAMHEFAAQQNVVLVEVLRYALTTIEALSERKPIRGLDERIAYFNQTLKEHGK